MSEPAAVFVTVHGTTGDVVDAATGRVLGTPNVSVDRTHRQVTVLLPYALYDTRGNTALRVAEATGLWNNATSAYLLPSTASSATVGGGAGALVNPPAFYNVAFRHAEPSVGASLIGQTTSFTNWRDNAQGTALATGDLSSFYDTVDMTKLAAGTNDDMNGLPQGVPPSGHMNRILASHYEPFQGRDFTGCNGSSAICTPEYGSALEPYAVYVPAGPPPAGGYALTPLLHSLSENYISMRTRATNRSSPHATADRSSLRPKRADRTTGTTVSHSPKSSKLGPISSARIRSTTITSR